MNNPKESFAVRVIYNRSRNPPILSGENIFGCLENNYEKYDLTKISLINAFIDIPVSERTLVFSLYKNRTDMNLDQNMIPESEWSNYIISTTDEHKVYLKISYSDPSKTCASYSIINLKLKDY